MSLGCIPSCEHMKKEASSHRTLQTPSPSNQLFPKPLQHTCTPGLTPLALLRPLLKPQRWQPQLPAHPPPFAHLRIPPRRTAEPAAAPHNSRLLLASDNA